MKRNKVLLVDDEPDILEFLGYNLRKEGFEVMTADNGREAVEVARHFLPQLILLDVMMPEMDGIETCEVLRGMPEMNSTLIAFLTARGEDYSQLAGFDAGADDYISKPIKPKILVSRVKALIRRHPSFLDQMEPDNTISAGNFQIDKERYIVTKDGKDYSLPKKEFELISLLAKRPEKVFTREEIYHAVWGDDIIVGDRTIDVHIRKLREKFGEEHIQTIKGVGYKFVE